MGSRHVRGSEARTSWPRIRLLLRSPDDAGRRLRNGAHVLDLLGLDDWLKGAVKWLERFLGIIRA